MHLLKSFALLIPPISRLYEQRNQLVNKISMLECENESRQTTIRTLETGIRELEAHNRAMREDVERAKKKNGSLVDVIQDYARECAKFEARANECRAALTAASKNVPLHQFYWERNAKCIVERASQTKAYAIICSMGRTATGWISNAFNLHPQVFFSHGPDLEPTKHLGDDEETMAGAPRILEQMKSFDPIDADGYFDLLESRGDYVVYGNVHGLTLTEIPESPATFRRHYYACAIVRHPIPRLQSFVNKWNTFLSPGDPRGAFLELENFRESETADTLAKTYNVGRLDSDAMLFAKAVRTTLFYDKHYLHLGIPIFQMERLVSDAEYFLGLFHDVTSGLVEPTNKYIRALRELEPFDILGEQFVSAKSLFSSWDTWKQRYLLDEIQNMEMLGHYENLGYTLRPLLSVYRAGHSRT